METPGALQEPAGSPTGEPQVPAQVADGTAALTGAAPQGGGAPEQTTPYDWYNPDTWGERKPHDVMKEVQKKINELSETNKSRESELTSEREQRQQLLKEAEAVLRDDKLYGLYRQRLGLQPASIEALPPPQEAFKNLPMVELTPEMSINEAQDRVNRAFQERDKFQVEYTKNAVNEAVGHFKQELYKELGQSLAPMHKSKWKAAMDQATQSYGPDFMEVQRKVVAMIEGPYATQYTGENEAELIEKVFRAECPDQYRKHVLSTAAQKATVIASAATAPATRSVSTLPTDSSVESCVARANARAEASLRAKGLL